MKENREFVEKATKGWNKDKKLLVLGCGDGFEVKILKEMGWQNVIGITFTDEEWKGALAQGVDVRKGDIHETNFQTHEFDYVISKETLEHMLCPYIALWELNRIMKVGARFVHYIPSGPEKQRDWYHYNCFPDWLWLDYFHKLDFAVDEIRSDIWQLRYEGYKKKDKNMNDKIDLYSLSDYLGRVRKYP